MAMKIGQGCIDRFYKRLGVGRGEGLRLRSEL
jgi:hypothetical protein